MRFRTGAFVPGKPVVPMVVNLPVTLGFDPIFCSLSTRWHVLNMMAQPFHRMKVTFLPIYYPSAEEMADPKLYASNVKKEMLSASGLSDSELQYSDKLDWEKGVGYLNKEVAAKEAKLAKEGKLAEMGEIGNAAI